METKRIKWNVIVITLMVTAALFMFMTGCKSVPEDTSTPEESTSEESTSEESTSEESTSEESISVVITPAGTEFPNINIASSDGSVITYEKTSEVEVIAKGTTVNVHKTDDSSWSSYYNEGDNYFKGAFIKDRNVTLSSFIMGKYEVTQELYEAVMGTNPSAFSPRNGETNKYRPVETVSWYDAVAFCNKLTKATMSESDCVYYTSDKFKTVYESGTGNVYMNPDKKGYRLPTEAEWEFAARGGNPTTEVWNYAYAGVQTSNNRNFASMETDEVLNDYGWYINNASNFDGTNQISQEVGLKTANLLGLCDMSGNVWEWCYDRYNDNVTSSDKSYTKNGTVKNPLGATSGSERVFRGGSWRGRACGCAVSRRDFADQSVVSNNLGFRVCRSQ